MSSWSLAQNCFALLTISVRTLFRSRLMLPELWTCLLSVSPTVSMSALIPPSSLPPGKGLLSIKLKEATSKKYLQSFSVTPILSRLMEKSLVKQLLYPVLIHPHCSHLFSDQFGFRPTGSTTAALVYLLHHISQLLQDHHYVHVVALDFSKAFDTVRHCSLMSKLGSFPVPDCCHNWIIDYFSSRHHQTGDQNRHQRSWP